MQQLLALRRKRESLAAETVCHCHEETMALAAEVQRCRAEVQRKAAVLERQQRRLSAWMQAQAELRTELWERLRAAEGRLVLGQMEGMERVRLAETSAVAAREAEHQARRQWQQRVKARMKLERIVAQKVLNKRRHWAALSAAREEEQVEAVRGRRGRLDGTAWG